MLGMSPRQAAWQWHAVGKHPAAADYIHLLAGTPLTQALADWMTKGYDRWQAGRSGAHEYCSWRFWLRGGQKAHLVCGVVRDSSDRIGRPFPLMVVGEGAVKDWERQWSRLPLLLEKTWSQMERLAAQRYEDLKALSEALQQLAPPQRQEGNPAAGNAPPALAGEPWQNCQADLRRSGRAIMVIAAQPGVAPEQNALSRHAQLPQCCTEVPRAVFMGGSPRRSYLAVILQPLNAADFVDLWSVA